MADVPFSELVSLVLGVKSDHVYADTTTCRCGYAPADARDWEFHVASNQVNAILEAISG